MNNRVRIVLSKKTKIHQKIMTRKKPCNEGFMEYSMIYILDYNADTGHYY